MLKGSVIHTAKVKGTRSISFGPFEVVSDSSGLERIEVASREEDIFSVHVQFAIVASTETARIVAKRIADRVFNMLAFRYSLHLETYGPPAEGLFEHSFTGAYLTAAAFLVLGGEMSLRLRLGEPTVREIASQLAGEPSPEEFWYAKFRTAMSTTDDVDRFMALYRLLL